MSIAGYLVRQNRERLTSGEQLRKVPGEKASLDERPLEQRLAKQAELYERVDDYDPVLRDHCRL